MVKITKNETYPIFQSKCLQGTFVFVNGILFNQKKPKSSFDSDKKQTKFEM